MWSGFRRAQQKSTRKVKDQRKALSILRETVFISQGEEMKTSTTKQEKGPSPCAPACPPHENSGLGREFYSQIT